MQNNNFLEISVTEAQIIGISRHRILRDGDGVTTLVGIKGCPLKCDYCINKEVLHKDSPYQKMTVSELIEIVKVDSPYFLATNGGVAFGGGEPLLNIDFIRQFKRLCPSGWKINIETSLNIGIDAAHVAIDIADQLIVDVKSMNPQVYKKYTSRDNTPVLSNLRLIAELGKQNKVVVHLPLIPGYNDLNDAEASEKALNGLGYANVRKFEYLTDISPSEMSAAPTAYGKGICNILKHIRHTLAVNNNIDLIEDNCPMEVCLNGTCPKCEEALSLLSNKLNKHPNPIY